MVLRRVGSARKGLTRALAAASVGAAYALLAGCGAEPSSNAANMQAPAPPASADALMGAPTAPSSAPPPVAAEAPPPASTPYPSGGVLAMAPIPNPVETSRSGRRLHSRYYATEGLGEPSALPAPASSEAPAPAKPAHRSRPSLAGAASAAAAAAVSAHPTPQTRTVDAAGLQTALTAAVASGAVFTVPDQFPVGRPVEVALKVPANFVDTLKASAEKTGLAAAAATAALSARLSGKGFSVNPVGAQSLPLTGGRDAEFRWSVTALSDAAGPLRANLSTALLGEGARTLDLGAVTAPVDKGGKPGLRILGGALLLAIAGLAAAWLAQVWRPTKTGGAKKR